MCTPACCSKQEYQLGEHRPSKNWHGSKTAGTALLAGKKWQSCDVFKEPSVQTWFVYFSGTAQAYSINFGSNLRSRACVAEPAYLNSHYAYNASKPSGDLNPGQLNAASKDLIRPHVQEIFRTNVAKHAVKKQPHLPNLYTATTKDLLNKMKMILETMHW